MTKHTILATVTAERAKGDEPTIVISTSAVDRENDEVLAEGGDFAAYKRNPTVLWGHDYSSLPIGTTTSLEIVPGRGIRARWRWLEGDDFAARVRNAFEQGCVRAASIGFRPVESERNERGGRRFTRWELLEWSLVPVPANAEAVRTLKRLRLWRDEEIAVFIRDDEPVAAPLEVRALLGEVVPSMLAPSTVRSVLTPSVLQQAVRAELRRHSPLTSPFERKWPVEAEAIKAAVRSALAGIAADLPKVIEAEFKRRRGLVD
jgi:HK97 family phage prohead protease